MTTAITTTENNPGAIVVAGLTKVQVDLVKRTICKDFTDDEFRLYLYQADRLNLDPLSRQIYTFKAGGKVVIGATIDGFRKRADGTGCYAPGRPTEYTYDDKGNLESCRVYVMKLVAGTWMEISEDAYYAEFKGSSPNWKTMGRVMLSKCAEARALRRAFPNELGGLYAKEERDAIERAPRMTRAQSNMAQFKTPTTGEAIETIAEESGSTPYAETVRISDDMGATRDELQDAINAMGHQDTDLCDWTDTTRDEVLTALETAKNA